jgi:hypothetical protein
MTKWSCTANGTWVLIPAPPKDLPYFDRIATLSAKKDAEK